MSICLDLSRLPLKCGPNEEYGCALNCTETCTSKAQLCSGSCKMGCLCQRGYVRQSDVPRSPCVRRDHCSRANTQSICGENEEYNTCGSPCSQTCNDIRYPQANTNRSCLSQCKTGCFCKSGYYRREDGRCVSPRECCGSNERYRTCGSSCVETCDSKPVPCTEKCVVGCFCGCSEFVRMNTSLGSPCVRRSQCRKTMTSA